MDVADWVAKAESLPFLQFVPVDNRIAIRATRLPEPLHADPADRIIVATTLALGATLVTKDDRLRRYRHVDTLW
jgi:PIN domain nuclease of toxin-antitoxin system